MSKSKRLFNNKLHTVLSPLEFIRNLPKIIKIS